MSPRPNNSHLRKPEIVALAAEVLCERGLLDTRISDIAQRAGVSAPTILYYFDSKENLLIQALDHADQQFHARLQEGQQSSERASEKLLRLIEDMSSGPHGLGDFTLWMEIWVKARRDKPVRDVYASLQSRLREMIAAIVIEGQAAGEFQAKADPEEFAGLLAGAMDGIGVQLTLGCAEVSPELMIRLCSALVRDSLGCQLQAVALA
jgi:AcrR family transcriptional regulator